MDIVPQEYSTNLASLAPTRAAGDPRSPATRQSLHPRILSVGQDGM